jgi:hypothetical protein
MAAMQVSGLRDGRRALLRMVNFLAAVKEHGRRLRVSLFRQLGALFFQHVIGVEIASQIAAGKIAD